MIIGIIVEFNPFHNGHKHLIDNIKKKYPNSTLIAIMSSDIVLRGDLSIISKFDRAKIALENGIDLVFSMNPESSLNAAHEFAKNSITHLNKLGIEKLIFGSESNNIEKLIKISNEISKKEKEISQLREKEKISYNQAVNKLFSYELKPNDILAVEYIKNINLINKSIKFESIKRIESDTLGSASLVRKSIHNKKFKTKINNISYKKYEIRNLEDFNDLFKYKLSTDNSSDSKKETDKYFNFIKNNYDSSINYWKWVNNNSLKNITTSSLRRASIKKLFNIDKNENKYIRLLSCSNKGKKYLKTIDNNLYFSKFDKSMKSELLISKVLEIKYKGTVKKEINFKVISSN